MIARKQIYDKNEPGVYHCFSRCVRRAFLCGKDELTGNNYDHRKQWIEQLLERAARCYVIDILAFSVLDNHFHVLLRNRPDLKEKLSSTAVARRWLLLHPKRRDERGQPCEPSREELREITADPQRVKVLRNRLGDISWLMAYVKERVARRANREDQVKGAFFEKRFEMTRLLSENAVLACSIYIDLNPIRAGVAKTPETAEHTSAYLRIQTLQNRPRENPSLSAMTDCWLAPLNDGPVPKRERFSEQGLRAGDEPGLAVTARQYLELLDWTGRQTRADKRGRIPEELAPILQRLEINVGRWHELATGFQDLFNRIAGNADAVQQHAATHGRRWFHGLNNCRLLFARRD